MVNEPGGGGKLGGPPWGIGCCCSGLPGDVFTGAVPGVPVFDAVGGRLGSASSHSEDKSPELNLKFQFIEKNYYSFLLTQ